MSSRHYGSFYNDGYDNRAQQYQYRDHIFQQFEASNFALTLAILIVPIICLLLSQDHNIEGGILQIGSYIWDACVFIIPGFLLFALDRWFSPAAQSMADPQDRSHAAKSEALSRLMGLDRPGGFAGSVFRARTRALSMTGSVLGIKIDLDRPAGLGNRDNSCYQNSVLQGLASLESLPDFLKLCASGSEGEGVIKGRNVAQTLRALISDLNDADNNGRTLWTPSVLKSMSTWQQQDAQEYYSKVLDDIDKGATKGLKAAAAERASGLESSDAGRDESAASVNSDDSGYQSLPSASLLSDHSAVRNPLEGLLAQRVACVQCGYSDGLSMIPFNCLTLSLSLDKSQHDLYERLDSYSKIESIEGVECPKCSLLRARKLLATLIQRMRDDGSDESELVEPLRRLEAVESALEEDLFDEETIKTKCKVKARVTTTKTKQMVIARPPQSLVLHLNRSVFDPNTFNMIKNSAPVNFPLMLDLGPWCLGSAAVHGNKAADPTKGAKDSDEERWQLDPMASMIAGDTGLSRLNGPIYELKAAVTHAGRHENGHYVCYRKYPRASPPDAKASIESKPTAEDSATETEVDDIAENLTKVGLKGDDMSLDWWRLSDHNVSKVHEDTVMSLSHGAFMLFYECVDPSMIIQPEEDTSDEYVDEKGEDGVVEPTDEESSSTEVIEGTDTEGETEASTYSQTESDVHTEILKRDEELSSEEPSSEEPSSEEPSSKEPSSKDMTSCTAEPDSARSTNLPNDSEQEN